MEKIDNNTTKILRFIYKYDSVVIKDVIEKFQLTDKQNDQYIISLLQFLISEGYMGLIVEKDVYVLKHNLSAYLAKCDLLGATHMLPTQSVYLLPPGRALVEIANRNRWYFLAPFAVSALSMLISLITFLYQVLDQSPILVKLLLK